MPTFSNHSLNHLFVTSGKAGPLPFALNSRLLGTGPAPFQITPDGTCIRLAALRVRPSSGGTPVPLATLYPGALAPNHIASQGRITLTTTNTAGQKVILQITPDNDLDSDGLPDDWEKSFSTEMLSLGAPPEHWGANMESLLSGNLDPMASLQIDGMTNQEIYNTRASDHYELNSQHLFIQGKRAHFSFGVQHTSFVPTDGSPAVIQGGGSYTDGSSGYGSGTIESWSRTTPTLHQLAVQEDPFSVAPNTSIAWFDSESQDARWSYHTAWEQAHKPNAPTLFPIEDIGRSSDAYILTDGGSNGYYQFQYTEQEGARTVTEWAGEAKKSKFRLYRLQPTAGSVKQKFLKVTEERSITLSDYEPHRVLLSDSAPVTTVELITATIPAYGHTSPWIETSPETEVQKSRSVDLLPVDLDIVHPATGEVDEGSEDSTSAFVEKGKGGLVALRRNTDTPLTKLVLRAAPGLPLFSRFRLSIISTLTSGKIKIWKDQACTDELVISHQTEFDTFVDNTVYVEGVKEGFGGDLKILQEIRIMDTWYQGDEVSLKVVHAEIPVVLRAFIPHTWTQGEGPFPVDATIQLSPSSLMPHTSIVFSDVVGGDRTDFSLKSYDDENLFRLKQEIIMTPYKELHHYPYIESKRRADKAPLSRYYKRSEDIPSADQGAKFGENFIPFATPNWSFIPPDPSQTYKDAGRDGDTTHLTVSLSGGPGSPPWAGWALPNIDTSYEIKMERMEAGTNPFIRVTMEVTHDLYPAYEAIVGMPDGTFEAVYQHMPLADILPGPDSVGTSMEGRGAPLDIH